MSTVLVVDDDAGIRDVIARTLRAGGYQVDTVGTGGAALTAATARRPNLVVLDLDLPDMTGMHVLQRLIAVDPTLAVIIVSGVADVRSRVDALETGARDFLPKPFALAELLARVRARLRSGGPAASPRPVWRNRPVELVGQALDLLRAAPGTAAVDAVIDQAYASVIGIGPDTDALLDLLDEICSCQQARCGTSPALEASFRALVAALAEP